MKVLVGIGTSLALALVMGCNSSGTAATPKTSAKSMKGKKMAIIHTSEGEIKVKLFEKEAPETVANFVGLATGEKEWTKGGKSMKGTPLYNGTIFHRVIPNFMIQGGDPDGTGMGGPGYKFKDEFDPSLTFTKPGLLAMANAGPGTNGSQFFITVAATPWLNNKHTIFGEVEGEADMAVVNKIVGTPKGAQDRPTNPPTITKIDFK